MYKPRSLTCIAFDNPETSILGELLSLIDTEASVEICSMGAQHRSVLNQTGKLIIVEEETLHTARISIHGFESNRIDIKILNKILTVKRRSHEWIEWESNVSLRDKSTGGTTVKPWVSARSRNISPGGMQFEIEGGSGVGEMLDLRFSLRVPPADSTKIQSSNNNGLRLIESERFDDITILTSAQVMNRKSISNAVELLGMRFLGLTAADERAISDFTSR